MQLNIFATAAPLLRGNKSEFDTEKFLGFLGHYDHGDWIYPAVIHHKLNIDIRIVYDILELFRKNHLIEQYLEICCPSCARFTGQYFKTISEIPSEIYCPHCDYEIVAPIEHAVIIYRVF